MFTGIIEGTGTVRAVRDAGRARRLTIGHPFDAASLASGDSVACDGCCLTVVATSGGAFDADVSHETLDRTTVGAWLAGTTINLERSLLPTTRMGGHLVQGHVDAVGRIASVVQRGEFFDVIVHVPAEIERYLVPKGSVAVDGISLTVNELVAGGFRLTIVPHTWNVTSLRTKTPGAAVNIETDVIARYVERLLGAGAPPAGGGLTMAALARAGFAP